MFLLQSKPSKTFGTCQLGQIDLNNRLFPLSMIPLSGAHCSKIKTVKEFETVSFYKEQISGNGQLTSEM
jgi:hypothetical protein